MKPYDLIPILPNLLAEKVATQVYDGTELSLKIRNFKLVDETEEKRKKMTHDDIRAFSDLCDELCRQAYEANASWFVNCAKSKTNRGRNDLEMVLKHWLCVYLYDPAKLIRLKLVGEQIKKMNLEV